MTTYYMLNTLGVKLSDESLETISMPRFELGHHILLRTAMGGSIIGGALVGPAAAIYNRKTDKEGLVDSVWYHGKRGFKAGSLLGGLLGAGFVMKLDYDGIRDRSYRLRCNQRQVFVDRLTLYGTIAGAGVAYYLGEELTKGAWFGFTGGCLFASFVNAAANYVP